MPAVNYTPIQLYYSSTASAVPLAANLYSGELALNTADGKLYYKDNAGAVQLLSTSTTATGTANGVLYLNGSKVATSGSALTFDGTNFAIGAGGSSAGLLRVWSGSNDRRIQISNNGTVSIINSTYGSAGASPLTFQISDDEQMRLTSTGLGIGTSSPAYKLDVASSAAAYATRIYNTNGTAAGGGLYVETRWNTSDNYVALFKTNSGSQEVLALKGDGNIIACAGGGNLGLGVTPSAWSAFAPVLQIKTPGGGAGAFTGSGVDNFRMFANTYYDGAYKRYGAGYATQYEQATGYHAWYTAASSTANSTITFTQAMTLDASGNLGIGATSGFNALSGTETTVYIKNSGANIASLYLDAVRKWAILSGTSGQLGFYDVTSGAERARIDSSGNFLIGKTGLSDTGAGFAFGGGSNAGLSYFARSSGIVMSLHRYTTTGDIVRFVYDGSPVGTISVTGSATAYNTSSDYRLKNIDGPLTGSGAFIDALKPKVGTWKADGSRFVGFIAHEVQEVSPGSVVGEKDGEQMQAMEYGSAEFIANIIAELQSLRARVAALES